LPSTYRISARGGRPIIYKLFVILGIQLNKDYLAVIASSKTRHYDVRVREDSAGHKTFLGWAIRQKKSNPS
jgi:hypothetical protein